MNKENKKAGFTLVEVLITVVIVAILAAIATPIYMGAKDKCDLNAKISNAKALQSALGYAIADGVASGGDMVTEAMVLPYGIAQSNLTVSGKSCDITMAGNSIGNETVQGALSISAELCAKDIYGEL